MQAADPKKAGRENRHPADVIAALRKAGWTLAKLAHHHDLEGSTGFSAARVRSQFLYEKCIAAALEMHPKEIRPDRYHENGEHKPQGFRALHVLRHPLQFDRPRRQQHRRAIGQQLIRHRLVRASEIRQGVTIDLNRAVTRAFLIPSFDIAPDEGELGLAILPKVRTHFRKKTEGFFVATAYPRWGLLWMRRGQGG
jgi:Ner family transcriptional regulator